MQYRTIPEEYFFGKYRKDEHFCFMSSLLKMARAVRIQDSKWKKFLSDLNSDTQWSTTRKSFSCFRDLKSWWPRQFKVWFKQYQSSWFSWASIWRTRNYHCLLFGTTTSCFVTFKLHSSEMFVLMTLIKAFLHLEGLCSRHWQVSLHACLDNHWKDFTQFLW